MSLFRKMVLAMSLGVLVAGCATADSHKMSSPYDKPGFTTMVEDGRLWVFKTGSKELADFQNKGEPAKQVTRIAAGPNRMTVKSTDSATIDAYIVKKAGFETKIEDGRLWVFKSGSKEWEAFSKHGEPAKQVTRIAAGPGGMTVKSSDSKVIDEYLAAM